MIATHWKRWLTAAVLCGLVAIPQIRADEQEQGKKDTEKSELRTVKLYAKATAGKQWLGVHPMPIDDALKAQLGLKDRLIIHHVMPDSPAAKAGLQAHDIILKFGDKEIANMKELVEAVADAGDKESTIVVLRGGKETKMTIKPEDRPEDVRALIPKVDAEEFNKLIGKAIQGEFNKDGTFTWRGIGPGIAPMFRVESKATQFPEGLSITVSRENDQPAKITAKKDGKTYETTQDQLHVLPDDIRPFVERMLGKEKSGVMFGKMQRKITAESDEDAAKSLRQHIEVRKGEGNAAFQELRKELESLRKDVESLKESKAKQGR
jgi:membrane-associated protease RseP (regulator of RpoE activity)